MRRLIINGLLKWKNAASRKVLLLRGARQVGKTYIVRKLASEFSFFLEVNFEKDTDVHQFFDQNLDPVRICNNLSVYYGIPIREGETLVFFDEIQSCSKAIQSLRFFYESKPELHVIAAGSLLEFALEDLPSWGVGRIRSVFMYPLSFDEFLMAHNQDELVKMKQEASFERPMNEVFHERLKDYLKKFLIIGGMPEAVQKYITDVNDIKSVQRVLSDITTSYYDDFSKFRNRIPVIRLREVMTSIVKQAGGKFIYSKVSSGISPVQSKEALELLEMAGLVYKVFHTSGQGILLGADVNHKKFKVLLHDNGIFQQIAGLKLSELLVASNIDMLNKGSIAEAFAGVEMIKYSDELEKKQLYYWQREKRGSSAEVDYLIELDGKIIPVEVKSGGSGKMQSLNRFMEEKKSSYGIRISLENFSSYRKIRVIPLYAISNLFR